MGFTHSLSVAAVTLALIAFAPAYVYGFLGSEAPAVLTLFVLVSIGAGVFPDLDNSSSSAQNRLGVIGTGLSLFFRESARLIMSVIRKRGDDPTPDPHRGFWHTIEAASLLGVLVYLLTQVDTTVTIPLIGVVALGVIFAYFIAVLLMYLGFTVLLGKVFKKAKKLHVGSDVAALLTAFVLTYLLMPKGEGLSYQWLAVSLSVGCIIHTLGDTFTRSGVCFSILLNLIFRKKLWWHSRIAKLETNGPTENVIVVGVLVISIIVSAFYIAFR